MFLCGLVGPRFEQYRTVVPLLAFLILLLASVFTHSVPVTQLNHSDMAYLRMPTPWRVWAERLLTVVLLPAHLLFLADQADLTCTGVHAWVAKASKSSVRVDFPYRLSSICSLIVQATHVLIFFCLPYIELSSSLASAVYGLWSYCVCVCILLRIRVLTTTTRRG